MSICFLGDQHGNISNFLRVIDKIEKEHNPQVYFQLGDFGFMGEGFLKFLKNVNKKMKSINKNIYFIDGNHENHNWLRKNQIDDLTFIDSNVIYVRRGAIITLNEINLLCVGGAISTDRKYRKLNKSYWEEEGLTKEEIESITKNLLKNKKEIDLFVTHDSSYKLDGLFNSNYFSNYSDYLKAVEHRKALQYFFDLSKSIINIHGHNHKYYYDEIITGDNDNYYKNKIKYIEICLNCDNGKGQYMIFSKELINQFKEDNYESVYDYFLKNKEKKK